MGLVLSVWKRFRKKTSTKEILEGIEQDIKRLEKNLHRNRHLQKKTALILLLFSIIVYIVAATIFYLWLLPDNWSDLLLWIFPFLCFPIIAVSLRRVLHFIFVTRINKHAKELESLNKEKKKILEDVMDNEIYKVAKELLTKYDPEGKLVQRDSEIKPGTPVHRMVSPGQELRHRPNAIAQGGQPLPPHGPQSLAQHASSSPRRPPLVHQSKSISLPPARFPALVGNGQSTSNPQQSNLVDTMSMSTPNLTCPILPRERSFFDKVAEYFIGDGPGYRYALICKQCFSHNGMALEDEFEFIAFRCCYCGMFNPSRKKRLSAPSLEDVKDDDSEASSAATVESVVKAGLKREHSLQDVSTAEEEDSESEAKEPDKEESPKNQSEKVDSNTN